MKTRKLLIAGIGLLVAGSVAADTFYLHADMATNTEHLDMKNLWFDAPTGGTDMETLGASFAGNRFDVNGWALKAANNDWSTISFDGTIVVGSAGAKTMEMLTQDWNVAGIDIGDSASGLMRVRKGHSNLSVGSMVLGSSARLDYRINTNNENKLNLSIADLSGSGTLSFGKYSTAIVGLWSVAITDSTPEFTGTMNLQWGELAFSNSFSLAEASLTIDDDKTNTVVLDNAVSFGSMEYGATSLAADTYTAAELNAALGTTRFSGSETLTVIPEPGTLGLLGFSAAGLLLVRRRFKK